MCSLWLIDQYYESDSERLECHGLSRRRTEERQDAYADGSRALNDLYKVSQRAAERVTGVN